MGTKFRWPFVHSLTTNTMKKTLTALAVLALSGTAMAQVTITGNLTMGYKATKSAATGQAEASGLGVDTSEINFAAKEDLGGGQTIVAKMALAGADRSGESGNGTVGGRDATLTYTNMSVGQIELGSTSSVNYFAGIASAGAPVIDFDGKLYETRSSSDYISYTIPVGPVYLQLKHSEASSAIGLGKGSTGSGALGQRNNTVSAYYSAGALTLLGAYRIYDNRRSGDPTTLGGFAEYAAGTKDDVVNVQASYDFGVAKVGGGYQVATASNGVRVNDALVGVAVPVGSWSFGATFAQSQGSDAKSTSAVTGTLWDLSKYNGTANGYSLGASYAFSKRTSISAKYAQWTKSGYSQYEAAGAAAAAAGGGFAGVIAAGGVQSTLGFDRTATETSILLSHSF